MKILHKILKKIFVYFAILGKNNKVVAVKNGKEYKILFPSKKFKILGDNNKIIINCDKNKKVIKKIPKGLHININGNNNTIELELPIKFNNFNINMQRNENYFSIKSTKNKVANGYLTIFDKSSVIIGKDSEIGNGDLRIISKDNYNNPHKIIIGDRVHIARETLIRNSDGQCFINPDTGNALSEPQDIIIGNDVWIMSRCMVVKGAFIPNGCAVAPYSFINKNFTQESALLAGIPAQIKKSNIKWIQMNYREYMESLEKSD